MTLRELRQQDIRFLRGVLDKCDEPDGVYDVALDRGTLQRLLDVLTHLEGDEGRMFPIQGGPAIPWSVIEPCEQQAQRNHGQSLQRLAERGGLSVLEAIDVLLFREWDGRTFSYAESKKANAGALAQLLAIVKERQASSSCSSCAALRASITALEGEMRRRADNGLGVPPSVVISWADTLALLTTEKG